MDQWQPLPPPPPLMQHNKAHENEPRGLLHKQLYGCSNNNKPIAKRPQQETVSSRTSRSVASSAQQQQPYIRRPTNLYQPPAIIKQLNSKHRATYYPQNIRCSSSSSSSSLRLADDSCAHTDSNSDERLDQSDRSSSTATHLPMIAGQAQRKLLAFFYIYAIVVASLFLTYVAYCFVQSHLWRRSQQQQQQQQQQKSASLQSADDAIQAMDSSASSQLEQQRIESKLALLERYVEIMAADLEETKMRLKEREKCRCSLGCSFNGTNYEDGSSWRGQQCDNCACKSGKIVCTPVKCPKLTCDLSEQAEVSGKCCPVCMKRCKHNNSFLKHNQVFFPPADSKNGPKKQCKCQDGLIKCEPRAQKQQSSKAAL